MDTNSKIRAEKKIVSVEILHLDELGYGPQGLHTRREWRKECLDNLLAGKTAFETWQIGLESQIDRTLTDASFNCKVKFDDNSFEANLDTQNAYSLDYVGHTFESYLNVIEFQFLQNLNFNYSTFCEHAFFSQAVFKKDVLFRHSIFVGTAAFQNANFNEIAEFSSARFRGDTFFTESTFLMNAVFRDAIFFKNANFAKAKLKNADFVNVIFNETAFFGGTTIRESADFKNANFFNIAAFGDSTLGEKAQFSMATFKDKAFFNNAIFNGADFKSATFQKEAFFKKVIFNDVANFANISFLDMAIFLQATFSAHSIFIDGLFKIGAHFENSIFENVGHFERTRFITETPSFRGCKIAETRLEFSDETYFPRDEKDENAIKNISFLKRLADEHGQTDQALNFNAMELRAKRLQNVPQPATWSFRLITWLYEPLSDYGRSFTRPIFWYIVLICLSGLLAMIYSTYSDSPPEEQQVLCKQIKDQPPPLKLPYGRAVVEYAMFRAGGLMDFTDTGKQNNAVNCRLFEEPIEPPLMRAWGIFKGIASIALLFLAALGLRNKYRIK